SVGVLGGPSGRRSIAYARPYNAIFARATSISRERPHPNDEDDTLDYRHPLTDLGEIVPHRVYDGGADDPRIELARAVEGHQLRPHPASTPAAPSRSHPLPS